MWAEDDTEMLYATSDDFSTSCIDKLVSGVIHQVIMLEVIDLLSLKQELSG